MRIITHNIADLETSSFDSAEYSAFKHGEKHIINSFAEELAENIIKLRHKEFVQKVELTEECSVAVFGAPYNKLETASSHLARRVVHLLNLYYVGTGIIFNEYKINRQHSYTQDYSKMSAEDRDKALTSESFEFEPDHHAIAALCDWCLFIDDIYITGSHERRIQELIDRTMVSEMNYDFCYYAFLQEGVNTPELEDSLNNQKCYSNDESTIGSVLYCLGIDIFIPNTRVIKRLFSANSSDWESLLYEYLKDGDITLFNILELKEACEKNEYHIHPTYQQNYNILIRIIDELRFK